MTHIRLANHYVLQELSEAIERGDMSKATGLFGKYTHRYSLDSELSGLACTVSALEKINNEKRCEIKARLKKLCVMRRLKSLRGSADLLPNRLAMR